MTAPSDFNSTPELDATLVFRVAYDGSRRCFAVRSI